MLAISLPDVDGNVSESNDFVWFLFMYFSVFLIFMYLGKNKYIIKHEDSSVMIFSAIKIVIWIDGLELWNLGNIIIISINFISCSVILVIICGNTFCLP